jgi:hypothetical protein
MMSSTKFPQQPARKNTTTGGAISHDEINEGRLASPRTPPQERRYLSDASAAIETGMGGGHRRLESLRDVSAGACSAPRGARRPRDRQPREDRLPHLRCRLSRSRRSLGTASARDGGIAVTHEYPPNRALDSVSISRLSLRGDRASSRGCRRRYTRNSHVDRANPTIDPTKNPATTPMTRPPVMRLVRLGAHHRPRLSMLQRQERPVNTRARAGRRRARVTASLPRRRRPRRTSAFPRPTGPPRHASRIGRAS